MGRKRQRKKKKQGIISKNLVVPFTRPHSTRVPYHKTKKGQRKEAKNYENEI
jgi:hypothetical protein